MPRLCRRVARRSSERLERPQRVLATVPWHEDVIMMQRCDNVRADACARENLRQGGRQADRVEAGMHAQADARPLAVWCRANSRDTFSLAHQSEHVWSQCQLGRRLKCVALKMKLRRQIGEQRAKVSFVCCHHELM